MDSGKYAELGRSYSLPDRLAPPDADALEAIRRAFTADGLVCRLG